MNRMAIFGARGYLGRQLTRYFADADVAVEEFDLPSFDVTDAEAWDKFDPERYDSVLYFAGMTGTERGFSEAQSFLSVNEGGLLHLLSRLSRLGPCAPQLVFPSTRLVYKGSESPLSEESEKEPKTVYAVNKLASEGYLSAYANRFGIPVAVLRICVPYGSLVASDYSYGTIGFFLKQLDQDGKISLYGDGSVRRTFTHVADICRAVETVLENNAVGTFNVGGEDMSLAELAHKMCLKKGGRVELTPWPDIALALESGSTVFDGSRLASLGFAPKYSLENFFNAC